MPVARLLAGIVLALLAHPAWALDLSGPWAIHLSFAPNPAGFPVTFTQNGSSLTLTVASGATLNGTIDSATGAFSVIGGDPLTFSCASLTGVAAADGNSMGGTYSPGSLACGFRPPTCICNFQTSSHFTACRSGTGLDCCGDEVTAPSEVCDAGPDPAGGCCDETCHARPAGTPCAADADPCTADTCDGAAACTVAPAADTDGDGLCDAIDPCPAGAATSKTSLKVSGFTTTAADDALAVRATLQFAATPALDPVRDGIGLQVVDAHGVVLLDLTVPPGASDGVTGWTARGQSFRFRSATPVGGIVTDARVNVSRRTPGQVRVQVTGKDGTVTSTEPALPLSARLVLAPADPAAACADVAFPGPAPAPSCTRRKAVVRCR